MKVFTGWPAAFLCFPAVAQLTKQVTGEEARQLVLARVASPEVQGIGKP
jgi:hypothetical protein